MKIWFVICMILSVFFPFGFIPSPSLIKNNVNVIIYVDERNMQADLYLLNLDDGIVVNLTNTSDYNELSPSWSSDGCLIAFTTKDIFILDIRDNSVINLTNTVDSRYFYPTWSPNMDFLAYSKSGQLYIMDLKTLEEVEVTNSSLVVGMSRLDWSSDGTRIIFDAKHNDNFDIYSINIDGTGLTNLSSHNSSDIDPSISPDNKEIVFSSNRDGNWEIYVMNIDSLDVMRLTFNEYADDRPIWSPDGQKILFISKQTDNWEIYMMNKDGTNITQLTDEPFVNHDSPDWQPTTCDV